MTVQGIARGWVCYRRIWRRTATSVSMPTHAKLDEQVAQALREQERGEAVGSRERENTRSPPGERQKHTGVDAESGGSASRASSRASSVVADDAAPQASGSAGTSGAPHPSDEPDDPEDDADMAPPQEHILLTPQQLNELLENRFNAYVKDSVPQMVKGMVKSLTDGLTQQVNALTEAHVKSDKKVDRLSSGVSAIAERMSAQEAASRERDLKMDQKMEQLQQAIAELRTSSAASPCTGGAASSSIAGPSGAHRSGAAPQLGEHIVLLEFRDPHLKEDMAGLEATWRSSLLPQASPIEVSAPDFHRWLTVKFVSFAEAASYAAALSKKVSDRSGAAVEVIHKGAKAGRPPHINRRGAALQAVYKEVSKQLRPQEVLKQSHEAKATPSRSRFFALNSDDKSVRELFTVEWQDNGEVVELKAARAFNKELTKDFCARIRALMA